MDKQICGQGQNPIYHFVGDPSILHTQKTHKRLMNFERDLFTLGVEIETVLTGKHGQYVKAWAVDKLEDGGTMMSRK